MPKPGFKSYSLKEELYNSLKEKFKQNEQELRMRGITSISAYFSFLISQNITESKSKKPYKSTLEEIKIIANKVIIKDNMINRIVELTISDGKIFCELDKKSNCMHVGFAYSLPNIYKLLKWFCDKIIFLQYLIQNHNKD